MYGYYFKDSCIILHFAQDFYLFWKIVPDLTGIFPLFSRFSSTLRKISFFFGTGMIRYNIFFRREAVSMLGVLVNALAVLAGGSRSTGSTA